MIAASTLEEVAPRGVAGMGWQGLQEVVDEGGGVALCKTRDATGAVVKLALSLLLCGTRSAVGTLVEAREPLACVEAVPAEADEPMSFAGHKLQSMGFLRCVCRWAGARFVVSLTIFR